MHLGPEETIIKVHHHHPFPFFVRALKIFAVSFPFFFVASLFSGVFSPLEMAGIYGFITVFFSLVVAHSGMIYYLDRLVMTNQRVVHIDWKNLFSREETEAEFRDIQDIQTEENGILARFRFFDYGTLRIQTASTKISIFFENANDPEGIKHFIYHILIKPARIRQASLGLSHHDTAPEISTPFQGQFESTETSVTGSTQR